MRTVEFEPNTSMEWDDLGKSMKSGETVMVAGTPHTQRECFARALRLDPTNSLAWNDLGCALKKGETANVNGRQYTSEQCFQRAGELYDGSQRLR